MSSNPAKPYAPIMLQHVNLVVPSNTLHLADEFYADIVGFGMDPVPAAQKEVLRWFRIGGGPQQIHVAFEREPSHPSPSPLSSRHPCFALPSRHALVQLQTRIWEHMNKNSEASAMACDEPGKENSGAKGVEYPDRFFVRDYAGNRLEFSAP